MCEVMSRVKRLARPRQSASTPSTYVVLNYTIEKARSMADFFRFMNK
jgi:hypothetical protein